MAKIEVIYVDEGEEFVLYGQDEVLNETEVDTAYGVSHRLTILRRS